MAAKKSTRDKNRPVPHPGAMLREIIIPETGLTIGEAALRLGVTRQTLHRILAEKSGITPGMALRIGKFCGNGPTLWLRMQEAHDLWHAERELADVIAKIQPARAA